MRLSTRLAGAMVLLVLLTVAAVGLLSYRSVEGAILTAELDRVETHAGVLSAELQSYVGNARADVIAFGAAAALDGIMRAHLAGGADPRDGRTEEQWRAGLARRFAAELAVKPAYLIMRVIGTADGGREILRVDRSGANGAIRRVPDAELRRKDDRDYFLKSVGLPDGQTYVSQIDLNEGRGNVVLRTAAPVHAPDGRAFGLIVINVDMRPLFASIRAQAQGGRQIFVVNGNGDYLLHPDASREFGFRRGHPFHWQDDLPELAAALGSRESGVALVRDSAGERIGAAISTVRPAAGPQARIIETAPYATLMAPAIAVRRSSAMAAVIAMACAVALAGLLARSLTRPLSAMTRAVEGFARNRPVAVPTGAGGEIGILARAFARMVGEVEEKAAALTKETEDLLKAREALLDSERMARGVIDTALDAFVQIDEAGRVVDWNPQAEAVFGWARDEAIGRALGELIVPERNRARFGHDMAQFMQSGEQAMLGKRFEFDAQRRDGKALTVEFSVTGLRQRDRHVFNGFVRDLTEKLAADEQRRQSQKMETVGQLTGGIAHDFNNILTVITGTIEILEDGVADDESLFTIAKMIDEAATRGAELTQRLLAFARRQPLQPRTIDVNALIIDAAKLLRPTLGEHIEIEAALKDDAWRALIDPGQLTTALINLALNARDAMPNGGKLTLETGNVRLDEAYAGMQGDVAPGPYVMIAVSDNGHGIPAAIRDKVFEPFFTTKGAGKGTGLGLSMVYGFVKQSNGHIRIYSEDGHGTTIKLYLPRAAQQADESMIRAAAAIEGGRETILVVEDDLLVRNYVAAQLASLGYATITAANADEALARIDGGDAFDLLFTDVIMPGSRNGRQLADAAARRRPSLKVLFTSGYTEDAMVHHGRLDAGVLLLAKPYRKSDLAHMIRIALAGAPHAQAGAEAEPRSAAGGAR